MHALSRSPISDTHFYICGSVVIDPSAAIAPGVLIQADASAQVVIRAGVCIGRGSIIHAVSGTIEIEEGVTLGTGVLVFGSCFLGAGSCVGANVSLVNYALQPGQLVPANSALSTLEMPTVSAQSPSESSNSTVQKGKEHHSEDQVTPSVQNGAHDQQSEEKGSPASVSTNAENVDVHVEETRVTTQRIVYGRASLDRVITMMFPHRQPLDSPTSSSDHPDSS
ncbi:MAG: hypothetical protein IGR76_01750 [Synechococcales cyanobacterium T60_A2020_003]|nr:hypothetical protein [Synechococcales cyanobacterium T60_A2020_003]